MIPSNVDELLTVAVKLQQLGMVGLLMLCVIGLIVVIYHKDKKNEQKHMEVLDHAEEKHRTLIEMFLKQRDEERKHHNDAIEAWRKDREVYAKERMENFNTLLRISSDSAAALHSVSTALREFSSDFNRLRITGPSGNMLA